MSSSVIKNFRSFLTLILLLASITVSAAYVPYSATYNSVAYNLANFKVDSLKSLLASSLSDKDNPTDAITINRINQLAKEFADINPDSTIYYGKMAISKSMAIRYKRGVADGMLTLANVYSQKG